MGGLSGGRASGPGGPAGRLIRRARSAGGRVRQALKSGGAKAGSRPVSSHEPAYPLGPRFAGPRQGLTMGSAPSTPDRSALRRKSTGCRTAPASTRQLGIRRRLRPTPCPPTQRHGASASRWEWRRGDGRPATSAPGTGSGAASRGAGRWGFKGVAESPCQTVRVKHGVGVNGHRKLHRSGHRKLHTWRK